MGIHHPFIVCSLSVAFLHLVFDKLITSGDIEKNQHLSPGELTLRGQRRCAQGELRCKVDRSRASRGTALVTAALAQSPPRAPCCPNSSALIERAVSSGFESLHMFGATV